MKADFDIIIVGSGFGGSLLAMIAKRLGKSVLLLEKGRHPRIVIGESTTPISNLLLQELATTYDLPRLMPLTKWGTWQRDYPRLACGLKRGFTFCKGDQDLLVEASPNDRIADTHWYRADVDHFFVDEARRTGVEYRDQVTLTGVTLADNSASVHSASQTWTARFLVDATGPHGFLHRALSLEELTLPGMPETSALYSHFSGVGEIDSPEDQPYPVNAAAVHHIIDNGWIWVLQFNNGITSAGVAAAADFSEGEPAWHRLLANIPALKRQFRNAEAVTPFTRIRKMPFRSASIHGLRWALLPSAAGFVDPLLSTGFPLTLFGIKGLAEVIDRDFDQASLTAYGRDTNRDLLAAGRLVAALYANMNDFRAFVALTMLYFAPVTFSEKARRDGRPDLAGGFLMRDREPFATICAGILERALNQPPAGHLEAEITAAIAPINVADLANPARKNRYPAALAIS